MADIYDQMQLRMAPVFRDYIHTAILHVATLVIAEPTETEHHAARAAMAKKIIETDEDVVSNFVTRVVFRAVMEPAIRNSVVKNGKIALEFADEQAVVAGVAAIWNETTLAVWPTVMDDIAEEE